VLSSVISRHGTLSALNYNKIYNMSDIMDKDGDFDAAFICIMMTSATTLLNLYAGQLCECCTKQKTQQCE